MARRVAQRRCTIDTIWLSRNDPDMTFPLRLTPFEKFVLWDERPQQPMTGFVELHFASPLDARRLQAALTVAVHRNPLLASRIVQRQRDLWWDYDPHYQPKILAASTNPPLHQGWPIPIDLQRECGSRYWYGATEQGWRLMIQFHHACCDGIGLRRVVLDTLSGYAQPIDGVLAAEETQSSSEPEACEEGATHEVRPPSLSKEKPIRWESLSMELLAERADYAKAYSTPPKRPLTAWQRIKNTHYFHFCLPTSLRGTPQDSGQLQTGSVQEPLRHARLSREQSERILERTRELQIGVNDLALALLFQTCSRWNEARGDCNRKSNIRLLMPFDLRSRVDLRMPATNRLSFSFLGRSVGQCADWETLLASVQEEVLAIKESRLPLEFLDALKLVANHSWLMKWVINRSRRMATVVLTYAGDTSRGTQRYFPEQDGTLRVGDTQLTDIYAAPPIREHTNISLGLCVNWGQLCFSAAWNRAAMSPEECEQFLSQYVASWQDWLASVGS